MVQRIVPRFVITLLVTGVLLVWAWEFFLAEFGAPPAIWLLVILGIALIFLSYAILIWREKH